MKRLATKHLIVIIPVVVVEPVPVPDPLTRVLVPVEVVDVVGVVGMAPKMCVMPSISLPIEYSIGLYFIWGRYPTSISHQVYSFLEHSNSPLYKVVTLHILTYCCIQISIAQSRNHRLLYLLSKDYHTINNEGTPHVTHFFRNFYVRGFCDEVQVPRIQGTKNQFQKSKGTITYLRRSTRPSPLQSPPPSQSQSLNH